jgi:putative aldouronate transport system permease protein
MNNKEKLLNVIGRLFVYLSLCMLFVVTFFPFWNIFVLSLNDASDSLRGGFMLWPREFSFESYLTVFKNQEILSSIKVTLARTIIGVPLTLFMISLVAYGLSKKDLVGHRFINFFFVFTMIFSGGMIPNYMVIRSLGLIDNFLVFIFPGMMNVFWMILIRTYMEALPRELEESAKIDGANDVVILFKIILPLCLPVLATIGLFSAINHWNAWYDSYIYTSRTDLKTLSAVLVKILNQYQTGGMLTQAQQLAIASKKIPVSSESIRMTVTMVATLPIIMVYPFIQRYFIKGMLIGSVKD